MPSKFDHAQPYATFNPTCYRTKVLPICPELPRASVPRSVSRRAIVAFKFGGTSRLTNRLIPRPIWSQLDLPAGRHRGVPQLVDGFTFFSRLCCRRHWSSFRWRAAFFMDLAFGKGVVFCFDCSIVHRRIEGLCRWKRIEMMVAPSWYRRLKCFHNDLQPTNTKQFHLMVRYNPNWVKAFHGVLHLWLRPTLY